MLTLGYCRRCTKCLLCDGDGEEENDWETAKKVAKEKENEGETATSFVCKNPFAAFEASKNYPKHFHNSGDIKKKANKSRK